VVDQSTSNERLLWALQERAKELACLYEVEELLDAAEKPLEDVFAGIIEAIPPGWQYPDICAATIEFEGRKFGPAGLVSTPWAQSADIVVQDKKVGTINVYYTEKMPDADEGPFLKEEGKLIRTIADRVGHLILHRQLRGVVQEWRHARASLAEKRPEEWRVVLNLLRRTDQDLFVRISRKMATHLAWSGIGEAQALLQGFGQDRRGDDGVVGETNEPSQRVPLGNPLKLADEVVALAQARLSGGELLERIERWIHEDRSAFLVQTVANVQASPEEVANAIRRYLHLVPEGAGLAPPTLNIARVSLIRRFLSREPAYIRVAKEFVDLEDILFLLDHLVCLPGSRGMLGGKLAGMFLAEQVLRRMARTHPEIGAVRVPRAWYVASDAVRGFVRHNNLEEVYEQKYKEIDQVRLEYPHLVQVFKNSEFPPELVKGLSLVLDDLHDTPIIVRSSSLLEDRFGAAFSGKYKSLFLANQGTKRERLNALMDAMAEVYASIHGPDPIQYRAERGLLDFQEEMGIMIQEVVGARVCRYYFPAYAGVALSRNEFRWSQRIKREDGLIRMVPGLGTRAVDRVREDYPVLVAPGQPALRVNVTPDEVARYSPQQIDVVDLEDRCLKTLKIRTLLAECGQEYPELHRIVSLKQDSRIVKPVGTLVDLEPGEPVVTFDGLISDTPLVKRVGAMLRLLEASLGHPVDMEFASDGSDFYLLQCRPQSFNRENVAAAIPRDLAEKSIVFSANRYVSNGRIPDVTHIVYVDPDRYNALADHAELQAVGRAVSRLNVVLPKRQFILIGPGRWGSRGDIKLGVNVTYSDINNTAMLAEIARKRGNYVPDLSFGTHFFQDLVEASIRYLPLYPDDPGTVFNERFLRESENELGSLAPEFAYLGEVVRVVDVPKACPGMVFWVLMNADEDRAVGILVPAGRPPDMPSEEAQPGETPREGHWRWRLRMAERIAAQGDAARFGVVAMYVFGSAKNATAGPGSDIDILVHVRGTEEQRKALTTWLEGWSLCLDEMNFLRTGLRSGGLLDVHLVTDEDIAARSSYAVKIGNVTDAAWELPLRRS
jgi:pyruvate, water dikinase